MVNEVVQFRGKYRVFLRINKEGERLRLNKILKEVTVLSTSVLPNDFYSILECVSTSIEGKLDILSPMVKG